MRASGLQAEDGFSLTELLVTMTLTLVLGTIIVTSIIAAQGANLQSQNTSEVLAQARVAVDRVSREVRSSRRLLDTTSARTLEFWLDADADGLRDLEELITYEVRDAGDGSGELVRWTQADPGAVQVVARALVVGDAFTYPSSSTVELRFQFERGVRSSSSLDLTTVIRLRNAVATP